jgi:class 3 adenylate cyclase
MRRSAVFALIFGFIAAAVVIALHMSGALLRPEFFVSDFLLRNASPSKVIGVSGQCVIVTVLALGVAWVTLETTERSRLWWLFGLLLIELVTLTWIFDLAHVFFQPLPAILSSILSFALAYSLTLTRASERRQVTAAWLKGKVAQSTIDKLIETDSLFDSESKRAEVSAVVCDFANQSQLIEELTPTEYAGLIRSFVGRATQFFVKEGGYVYAANGEGVRVLFGFPLANADHAAAASGAALAFMDELAKAEELSEPNGLGKIDVRIGIDSGAVIAANSEADVAPHLLAAGEPIELARRFCMANRIYGSKILIGPMTFDLAEEKIVARPIDFLGCGEARHCLEVYELLSLAASAAADEVARRDSFWIGVVYFRQRRWNEAFVEFQKARQSNGHEDAPLQWYLHRLEPLCLMISTEPAPAGEPLPLL